MENSEKLEPFLQLSDKLYPFVYDGTSSIKLHALKYKSYLLVLIGRSIYIIKPINLLLNKMIIKDIFIIPEQKPHSLQLNEDIIDVSDVYRKIKKMKP